MDKASTMTAIPSSLQQPEINITDEASTPTNTGTITASAARRVAFSDELQDISNRLVQLSTTSTAELGPQVDSASTLKARGNNVHHQIQ